MLVQWRIKDNAGHPNSIEKFYNQEELLDKIKSKNFENVSFRNINAGIVAIHSAWKI